jgi:hypothetical protein
MARRSAQRRRRIQMPVTGHALQDMHPSVVEDHAGADEEISDSARYGHV